MKSLLRDVLSALLWLGLGASAPAAEKGVDFRTDAFVGQQDGYHRYYCQRISIVQVDRASLVAEKGAQAGKTAGKEAETQRKTPEVSEAAKGKLKARFGPLFKEFGRNSATKVAVVSGPKEVKMRNGGVSGQQWIATSGKHRFKLTIQDSTGVKLEQLVERLQKLPGPYMRACAAVSDEGEDGIAIYANLGGASAHGGQAYISIVPRADALVIAHEAGHTLEQLARAADPKILDMWEEAIKADKVSVSDYGDHVRHEDLAEFAQIYAVCLGAGAEHLAALKELSLARFALWEKILKWPDRD